MTGERNHSSIRILIYGAGVIGSLYAVLFAEAGFSVTVYARGKRLDTLLRKGLLYRDNRRGGQRRLTCRNMSGSKVIRRANVQITDHVEDADRYHFVFLTVQWNQAKTALTELRGNCSPNIVTMVNSPGDYAEWEKFCGRGRILPAFPGAGGGITDGILEAGLTPWIIQPTTCGEIGGRKTRRLMALTEIFHRSGIPCQIVRDMNKWQLSHLGLVTPLGSAYERSGFSDEMWRDWGNMRRTVNEIKYNFNLLAACRMLSPAKFHLVRFCPTVPAACVLRVLLRGDFGDMFVFRHAKKSKGELQLLRMTFNEYLEGNQTVHS